MGQSIPIVEELHLTIYREYESGKLSRNLPSTFPLLRKLECTGPIHTAVLFLATAPRLSSFALHTPSKFAVDVLQEESASLLNQLASAPHHDMLEELCFSASDPVPHHLLRRYKWPDHAHFPALRRFVSVHHLVDLPNIEHKLEEVKCDCYLPIKPTKPTFVDQLTLTHITSVFGITDILLWKMSSLVLCLEDVRALPVFRTSLSQVFQIFANTLQSVRIRVGYQTDGTIRRSSDSKAFIIEGILPPAFLSCFPPKSLLYKGDRGILPNALKWAAILEHIVIAAPAHGLAAAWTQASLERLTEIESISVSNLQIASGYMHEIWDVILASKGQIKLVLPSGPVSHSLE